MSAKDLGTGKEQKIEIRSGSGLSDDEIKRMVQDAESHAEDDRRQRELAEARNNGENAAYQAERQLKDLGEAVDESSKTEIEAAIKDVREALSTEDAEDIKSKTDALQASFHKVSEAMYQRAQEQAAASGAPTDGDDRRLHQRRERRGGRGRRRGCRRGPVMAAEQTNGGGAPIPESAPAPGPGGPVAEARRRPAPAMPSERSDGSAGLRAPGRRQRPRTRSTMQLQRDLEELTAKA